MHNSSRRRGGGGGGRRRWGNGYYSTRMYGWFHCSDCDKNWESSNVHMMENKLGQYYTQQCKECETPMQPYRVEPIKCRLCGKESSICSCDKEDYEERHVDANKPHLSHLCARCKSGKPCRY